MRPGVPEKQSGSDVDRRSDRERACEIHGAVLLDDDHVVADRRAIGDGNPAGEDQRGCVVHRERAFERAATHPSSYNDCIRIHRNRDVRIHRSKRGRLRRSSHSRVRVLRNIHIPGRIRMR